MKKLLMTIGIAAISGMSFAQNNLDALSFSRTNPVLGTARYSGMAGAFNALGGNPSAIKDNPAALGVYRSMDLTFTPSLYINNDGEVKAALDNFAFVLNFGSKKNKHGYVTSSLGINYNRLNNISRYTRCRGERIPFSVTDDFYDFAPDNIYEFAQDLQLIDGEGVSNFAGGVNDVVRSYTLMEKGHVGQWDIAYGLNISNTLYVGAAFGFTTLDYKQTAMYDEETLPTDVYEHWSLDNIYEAEGHGFNFRFGAICRPIDEIRIGASFETPTYYDIVDYQRVEMSTENRPTVFDDFGGDFSYALRTPLKFKTGVGFVIGKKAMIGLDYQYENFKKIRMKVKDINIESEADLAEEQMNKTHTVKLGAEVQVADGFFLRAGTAISSSPMKNYDRDIAECTSNFRIITIPQNSFYVTGGAGYKGEHFYCDLAYVFQNQKDFLYPNMPLSPKDDPVEENLKTRNIIASFGWRF